MSEELINVKQRVYAVEDDAALRELYTYTLENHFICRCFEDGEAFFDALAAQPPDIILLDIMLPGEDGMAILSRLKADKAHARIPVILVSAKGDEISKVKGLNLGADDYIAKPFGVLELVARVRANLRKAGPASENITWKDILIDMDRHQVMVNNAPVQTTLKEYKLLCLLCGNPEKVQERERIFNEVWGWDFAGETRTLDIHIKELRKMLAENGSAVAIQTIRGVGYMLV